MFFAKSLNMFRITVTNNYLLFVFIYIALTFLICKKKALKQCIVHIGLHFEYVVKCFFYTLVFVESIKIIVFNLLFIENFFEIYFLSYPLNYKKNKKYFNWNVTLCVLNYSVSCKLFNIIFFFIRQILYAKFSFQ